MAIIRLSNVVVERFLCILSALLIVITVCSCGSGDVSDHGSNIHPKGNGAALKVMKFEMPSVQVSSIVAEGFLEVYVQIDGKEKQKMEIDQGGRNASITIDGIETGEHLIEVVFEYQSTQFGGVAIAVFEKTINLVKGNNMLSIVQADYEIEGLDDDSDGMSNYEELSNEISITNPKEFDNVPPRFTGASSFTYLENSNDSIQISVEDVNGPQVLFSIEGGEDAALFNISSLGELNFNSSPNFEVPVDQGLDNVYKVVVKVEDPQGASVVQTVSISVTDDIEENSNSGGNVRPVANIESIGTVNEQSEVVLNGSASIDSDGQIVSYLWTQTGGSQVALIDATSSMASFISPTLLNNETISFKLTVTDDDGATASKNISINVTNLSYTLSGIVSGLSGVLEISEGGETLTLNSNGEFSFLKVYENEDYAITIKSKPIFQNCSVSNASGTFSHNNVSNISIECVEKTIADLSFSDSNLATCVSKQAENKGWVLVRAFTSLTCSDENVQSVSGIEQLPGLTYLNLTQNSLTEVDVSKNKALISLYLSNNQLTQLDVSSNTALRDLAVRSNNLSLLDVSFNLVLRTLDLGYNQITELNVTQNSELLDLDLLRNLLTEFDVSFNKKLTNLNLNSNQIANLDVSQNTELTELGVDNNQLTEMDISQNRALTYLYLGRNQLTEMDLTFNTELVYLSLGVNSLKKLDVSQNTNLVEMDLTNNSISALDVSRNSSLKVLRLPINRLSQLDVSQNTELEHLDVFSNELTQLDISKNTSLKILRANRNQLETINIDNNKLTNLYISNNPLTEITIVYLQKFVDSIPNNDIGSL